MSKTIRGLILGLTVPILGGLLAPPSVAQTVEHESSLRLSPMQRLLLEQKPAVTKPAAPPLIEWPLTPDSVEQPVNLILRIGERQLYVYRGDVLTTTFPVAVGRPGWETPTGNFAVSYMLENPGWTHPFTGDMMPPGPNNPLGDRWIAFWTDGHHEIGFHGTPNRDSVGKAASHGCVRLLNEDVRELYTLVKPGTLVTILP